MADINGKNYLFQNMWVVLQHSDESKWEENLEYLKKQFEPYFDLSWNKGENVNNKEYPFYFDGFNLLMGEGSSIVVTKKNQYSVISHWDEAGNKYYIDLNNENSKTITDKWYIEEIGFGMLNNRCFIWKNENGSEWTVDKSPLDYEYTKWNVNDSSEIKNKGKIIPFNTGVIQDLNGNEVLTEHLEKLASKVKINDGYRINNDKTLEIVAFNENTSKTKQNGQFIFGGNRNQTYGTGPNNTAPCFGAEPAIYPVVLFNNLEDTNLNSLVEVNYNISEDDTVRVNGRSFPFDFKNDILLLYRRTNYIVDSRTTLTSLPPGWVSWSEYDSSTEIEKNIIFQIQSLPDSTIKYKKQKEMEVFYINSSFNEENFIGNYTEKVLSNDKISQLHGQTSFFKQIIGSKKYNKKIQLPPIAVIDWYLPESAFSNNWFASLGEFEIKKLSGGDPEGYFKSYLQGNVNIEIDNLEYITTSDFDFHMHTDRKQWDGTSGEKYTYDEYNNATAYIFLTKNHPNSGYKDDIYFNYYLEFFSPAGLLPEQIILYNDVDKLVDYKQSMGKWSINGSKIISDADYVYYAEGDVLLKQEPYGSGELWDNHYRKYGYAVVRWINGKRLLNMFKKDFIQDSDLTNVKLTIYNPFTKQFTYQINKEIFTLEENNTREHIINYDEWVENGLDYQCIENSSWIHFSDEDVPFEEDIPFETNTFTITKSTLTSSGVKFFLSNNIKNNIEVNFFDGASWRKITVAANSEITCQAPVSTYSSTKFTYKDPNTGVNIELLYNDIPLKTQ